MNLKQKEELKKILEIKIKNIDTTLKIIRQDRKLISDSTFLKEQEQFLIIKKIKIETQLNNLVI